MRLHFSFFILLFLLPGRAVSQPPHPLLERGAYLLERGETDSATFYYQLAYQRPGANVRLKALTGLVRIATEETELAKADSLLQLGEGLIAGQHIERKALLEFKIAKGEFFRKNSQLEEALQEQREALRLSAGRPAERLQHAYALFYTALTYERLAVYDSSLWYVNQAHDIFREALDTSSLKFSTIYNGMGACYFRANRLAEAKRYFLKSKSIAEEKLGLLSREVARCLNNLSAVARLEEDYQQAITYGEEALRIYRAQENEDGAAGAYYSLGIYHYYLGDYGRARDHLRACIAIRERLYGPRHYSLIGPYELIGITCEASGDYEKTLFYLEKGRKVIGANYDSGSLPEGFNCENTATCYRSTGQLDSALHYIRRANAILPGKLPENDYALAVHYFSYANILYHRDELEKASSLLRQSNRIYEALRLQESSEYALNLALQGLIYAEQALWPQADSQFERALDKMVFREESGGANPISPNILELLNDYTGYLFRKYQATGDGEALRRFEAYSLAYLELSDKFRKQFIDPYTKSVLARENAKAYQRNIGIYNHLYQLTGEEAYLQSAYRFSEYNRATLLRDLQDDNRIKAYAGLPDSVLQRERALRKKITRLNQQLLEGADSEAIQQELFAGKEALNAHIAFTLQHYPEYYSLKFNTAIPSLPDIQARLGPGHNLIEYMQDDTAYYALLIRKDSCRLLHLSGRQEVEEAVRDWQQKITTRDKQLFETAGRQLYRQIWQPLASYLQGSRITIIPSGALFYLNFETLPGDGPSAPFLIYDHNISYALSLSTLFSEEEKNEKGPVLAVAPGFEEEIKRQYQAQLDTLEPVDEDYLRTVRQPWPQRLVSWLQRNFTHHTFIGLEATEANIKANIHKGGLLYFGTHAIADADDPLRSRLVLAKEVGEQREDGYLHAYELFGLPLQAELAVLNACESGLGRLQDGEGMMSLAYGIHYAGCPATVMSLWKVDEKASTRITEGFLAYLGQGQSSSEALRQAKLDFLAKAPANGKHPFFWGGMVLMGQDEMVPLEKRKPRWLLWVGIGLFLALLGYGASRLNKMKL